mgnify:CR=1 FL=1
MLASRVVSLFCLAVAGASLPFLAAAPARGSEGRETSSREVTLDEVPEPARRALLGHAGENRIRELEEKVVDGKTLYEIELLVARINGRFGQPGITPVEYLHRDVSTAALAALYRRADVLMVTALRDGMNLVAQEFVLCQSEPGLPDRWQGALLV